MKKTRGRSRDIVLAVMIVILLVLISLLINHLLILEKKEIYTSVIVSNYTGFDLNSTALTFGAVQPGQPASRAMHIQNNFNERAKIILNVEGDIKDLLQVSENNFILESWETRKIGFTVSPPEDFSPRKYDGVIIILMKRV